MRLIFLFLALFLCVRQQANAHQRELTLEWEALPDAVTYDVEIKSLADKKAPPIRSQSTTTQWKGMLSFGKYNLRVRGRDLRRVPGEWSNPQEIFVNIEDTKILQPNLHQTINAKSEDKQDIEFKWQPVGGARAYVVEIKSKDGNWTKDKETSDTHLSLRVPVAAVYEWSVRTLGEGDLHGQTPAQSDFVLEGPPLAVPKIKEVPGIFVRELEWSAPDLSKSYAYRLTRYDTTTKTWIAVEEKESTKTLIQFAPKWSGGTYKLQVAARAPFRKESKFAGTNFRARAGDRSPAAEETATIRESIDRTKGWYGIASWLVTSFNYMGSNSDQTPGASVDLKFSGAQGGTGRLGAGYLMAERPWGFFGTADYSGMLLNNKLVTFNSLEGSGVFRTYPGSRSEIRHFVGGFYRDLPVILADSSTQSHALDASVIGPHYGLEYWQALTPKLGFQVNAHGYLNLLAIKTPNHQPVSLDFSYQFGFLGSYRLSKKATGLAGWANRRDSLSYKATNGNINRSTLTGNFINLYLEWQL